MISNGGLSKQQVEGKKLLLDTNILIYQLSGKLDLSEILPYGRELYISAITEAELFAGVERAQLEDLKEYIGDFEILPVTSEVAIVAGSYKNVIRSKSLKDLLIAATAQVHNLTLVTANNRDFVHLLKPAPLFVRI